MVFGVNSQLNLVGRHRFQLCEFSLRCQAGKRVRLNAQRLRDQCLPEGTNNSYSRVRIDGNLAGNVFACRWSYGGKNICWITQLVVHEDYRMRGLARALLNLLMEETDDIFGVMSSHPAACMAAATSYGSAFYLPK